MEHKHDQIKIEYLVTDKESNSIRIMCVFLILIFAFVPLAEIVADFDYNIVSSFNPTKYTCIVGWEFFEPLSFKEIR